MEVRDTSVLMVEGAVDMRNDPVVQRYVEIVAGLGERWGRAVVLDQHGYVVLGKRRYDRAVRGGEMVVPTARVDVGPDEARLLRLADFAEADGLLLLTLERIVSGAACKTGGGNDGGVAA